MPMDFSFLKDPSFWQYVGNTGSKFSQGKSAGEALNPSDWIRQTSAAKAGSTQLGNRQSAMTSLWGLIGGGGGGGMGGMGGLPGMGGGSGGGAQQSPPTIPISQFPNHSNLVPQVPVGPINDPTTANKVVKTITPDSTTTTITTPNIQGGGNYGSNLPLEATPAKDSVVGGGVGGGGANQNFFNALFGLK